MWNDIYNEKEEIVYSQWMEEEEDSQVITELTDFVIVGSAKTEEDGEGTPAEQHNSPEGPATDLDDDDGEDDSQEYIEDYTTTPETEWFSWPEYLRRLFNTGIPRTGHTRYADSYRAYAERAKEATQ